MTKQGARKRLNACVVHNFQCSSCEYEYDCNIAQVHDIAIECIERCMKTCASCTSFDVEYNECDYWGSFIINAKFCSCDKWESDNE